MTKKSIKIPILARVEGEGALDLEISNNQITQLHLKIYEPPRFFESFLIGRESNDVIDLVARICGICPVAYQMSAAHALEQAFNVQTTPWIRQMRRVFYCGEWIESHSLHIHLLAAPDFLGFNSAPEMAKQYADEVRRGLRLQSLGNQLIALFGGRSVHPVGARVGGFYRAPDKNAVAAMLPKLEQGLVDAEQLLLWLAELPLPDIEQDFIWASVCHDDEYPMNEGQIKTNSGLAIAKEDFLDHFTEEHVPYSTALHSSLDGESYLVGPLARLNNNYHLLPDKLLALLKKINVALPTKNMFHSIIARAAEIYYAIYHAQQLLINYKPDSNAHVNVSLQPGKGYGCTEAPRGMLWQYYEVDEQGLIMKANIIPPTSQNQARIEADLYQSLHQFGLQHSEAELRSHSEMVIRNYDPCISCSTHFLNLTVKRR